MNHQQDDFYQDSEDDFLSSYQLEHDCQWEKRVRRAKTVNFLAICVLREYREKLRSDGVLRRTRWRSKDIEFFRTIPMEIMLEIMEYLHPIDLLHLTKTDTTFRELLKDRSSTSVWRSAFGNYPDIPEIPSNLTGYKWAVLLFSPSICERCSASPAHVILTFYRRQCDDCLRKEFISTNHRGRKQYTYLAPRIARHALVITVDPSLEGMLNSPPVRFNRAELHDIKSTLQRLQNAIDAGLPDAKEALESYKLERNELITTSEAEYRNCSAWATFYQNMLSRKTDLMVPSLLANIKSRFKRLGFEAADVDDAAFNRQIFTNLVNTTGGLGLRKRGKYFLCSSTFCTLKPLLCYPPVTWAYLPPFSAVMQFDSVSRLTKAPPDDLLVEKDVLKLLPQEVDDWTTPTMKKLVSFLPSSSSCAHEVVETTASPDLSALNLATSVFQCHGLESMRNNKQVKNCFMGPYASDSVRSHASERAGGCLIGWEGAVPHLGCRALEQGWEKGLHFSQRGHDAAQVIIRLLGLDPATTKIWEMDALDKRFVCMICQTTSVGRTAYTWEDAVHHQIEMEKRSRWGVVSHDTVSWSLVGPEAEEELKSREEHKPNVWQSERNWMCNHCSEHFENRVPLVAVVEHAKEM
ncbi:hypothetical protein GALMADRAFT_132557 [Galerina marginata CBS 339.88]|uniref:F-box domain-containing protein n=1 Tax=Galerina marginata (strain CBS 339.88) TaxID=685588 RepID=A0A067U108_GALM3|nr:hypothetical protein GALMADRAFT_132557 [Galerina marginata CBS 339.88]